MDCGAEQGKWEERKKDRTTFLDSRPVCCLEEERETFSGCGRRDAAQEAFPVARFFEAPRQCVLAYLDLRKELRKFLAQIVINFVFDNLDKFCVTIRRKNCLFGISPESSAEPVTSISATLVAQVSCRFELFLLDCILFSETNTCCTSRIFNSRSVANSDSASGEHRLQQMFFWQHIGSAMKRKFIQKFSQNFTYF